MSRSAKTSYVAAYLIMFSFLIIGCAPKYQYKAISVRDASSFRNAQHLLGLTIGGEAYYDDAKLKEMFGFNIKKAGMVPVQVVVDNAGAGTFTVLADGVRLMDADGNWWETLPPEIVSDRVSNFYNGTYDPAQVGKETAVMAVAGAVVGAAVGVASGHNIGNAVGTGAAIGGAAGLVKELIDPEPTSSPYDISRDLSNRSIAGRTIQGEGSLSGFFYFPAESKLPKRLKFYVTPGDATGQKSASVKKSRRLVELYF